MKLCKHCGKPVKERKDREVKFCSRQCSGKFNRTNFPKPCQHCQQTFQPPQNHPKQKFCSTKCRDNARRTSKQIPCDTCGEPTIVKVNRLDRLDHHFCSKDCYTEWQRNGGAHSGKDHHQYSRVMIACDTCSKSFERMPSHIGKRNFCGIECRKEWQRTSGYTSGKNSPTWLGGCDDYRGPNWDKQANKARGRDNYTCQECGITQSEYGHALDVHHIVAYKLFNGDWKNANSLDNLVSLCNGCHTAKEWQTRRIPINQHCTPPQPRRATTHAVHVPV